MIGQGGHGGDTANVLAELDLLAALLDSRWRIPGTSIRFGLDALETLRAVALFPFQCLPKLPTT
jgi:hypothetical protein